METKPPDQDIFPYRAAAGGFTLEAIGRHLLGGVILVHFNGELIEEIAVPRSAFSVFIALAEAAKEAEMAGDRALAFVPTNKLADLLQRRAGLGARAPENIHRVVLRLRSQLFSGTAARLALLKGLHWDREILETHPLGYRLSVPPESLRFKILDEERC